MKRFLSWLLLSVSAVYALAGNLEAESDIPIPKNDILERFPGGGTIEESVREKMIYVGDWLKKNISELKGEIKDLEHYNELVQKVTLVAAKGIKDPFLGNVTARAVEVPAKKDPLRRVVEVDCERWKNLINGRPEARIGIEANAFRLAFHVGLMAIGENDQYAQISERFDVDLEDFEKWAEVYHSQKRPHPGSGLIEFSMDLRGQLAVGSGENAYNQAWANFSLVLPKNWKENIKKTLIDEIGAVAPILDIELKRTPDKSPSIAFPANVQERIYDRLGGPSRRGEAQYPLYHLKDVGCPQVGRYVETQIKVKVWVDTGGRRVEKRTAFQPIVSQAFTVPVIAPVNTEAVAAAHINAYNDHRARCEQWRSEYRRNPPQMGAPLGSDILLYVQSCNQAPALVQELYSWFNYQDDRSIVSKTNPSSDDKGNLLFRHAWVEGSYLISYQSSQTSVFVLTGP